MTDIITDINLNNYNDDVIENTQILFERIGQFVNPDKAEDYYSLFESILFYCSHLKEFCKIIWKFLSNHLDKLFDIIVNSLNLCGV
jgi:hypothetical protein